MKNYIPILKNTQLFAGIGETEIESMLGCLQAKEQSYKKGEYVLRQGQHLTQLAILVHGKLHIQTDDYWGNRSIVSMIGVGELFGESYVAPDSGALLNDVVAEQDSTVLFFDVQRMLTVCSSACVFHTAVVQNLCFALSEKNRRLVQKLRCISKRTTREKLISYLSEEAKRHNSGTFTIPFNRQELADYLSVDRSAMSGELSKMQKEGLLSYEKNRFTLFE